MNIKVKAGLIVAGILAFGIAVTALIKLAFTYISTETLGHIGMGIVFCGLLYTLYTLVLLQLESDARYKSMLDKKSK